MHFNHILTLVAHHTLINFIFETLYFLNEKKVTDDYNLITYNFKHI